MKTRALFVALTVFMTVALGACERSATAPAPEKPRFDGDPVCVEDGRGGHTLGGGNYLPGPCPTD